MNPFFSIVIPVYNRAGPLETALRSVLAQSDQDFEIVVVDDGSSDDPKAVIDALGDPRIHYVRRANGGGGAARNTGIDRTCGEFIAFLDSDDVFLPHHLQTMRRLLTGTQRTAGYARVIVDRGDGQTFLKPPRAVTTDEDMASYLLCDRGFVPTITTVVPCEFARRVRYDEDLREAEDLDFAVRLALEGCVFRMVEEPGAVWKDRFDPGRQSAARSRPRFEQWLATMRPRIRRRAYLGGMGWVVAKGVVQSDPLRALGLYLRALASGCYRPGFAAIVFLQIFLPDRIYRSVADRSIAWLRIGLPAKDGQTEKPAPVRPAC